MRYSVYCCCHFSPLLQHEKDEQIKKKQIVFVTETVCMHVCWWYSFKFLKRKFASKFGCGVF